MASVQGRSSAVAEAGGGSAKVVPSRASRPTTQGHHGDQADAGQVHCVLQPRAKGVHGLPSTFLQQMLSQAAGL